MNDYLIRYNDIAYDEDFDEMELSKIRYTGIAPQICPTLD